MNLKNILCAMFNSIGGSLFLRLRNKQPRVLFYHGVSSELNKVVAPENFHTDEFTRQMHYLKKNFNVISIDDFYNRLNDNTFKGDEVVITLDDGYANNLHIAAPILNQLNLPFTVFVSTNHIETGEFYPTSIVRIAILSGDISSITIPSININVKLNSLKTRLETARLISKHIKTKNINEVTIILTELKNNFTAKAWGVLLATHKALRPMNWAEVKELSKLRNVTIGSHCCNHICCHENQFEEVVLNEMTSSKILLEEKLSVACKYIAYPNGDYTKIAQEAVIKAKYKLGFAIDIKNRVTETERTVIPRIGVPREYNKFKIYLNLYPKK